VDPFSFSANPTEAQVRVALNTFLRGPYRLIRAAGVLMMLLGVLLILLGEAVDGLFGLLLGLGFAVAVPPLTSWITLRMLRTQILRPTRYEVGDEGVRMTNDQTEQFFRWSAVTKVDQVEGMLVGRLGRAYLLVIPTAELPLATASAVTSHVLSRVQR
jgi:hypothetical protein